MRQLLCVAGLLWLAWTPCRADQLTLAVATNFQTTATALAERFSASHGHQVRISSAATGVLYNQIRHGAGFDVLLAADAVRPRQLEQDRLSVAGSRFTYAVGLLAILPAAPPGGAGTAPRAQPPACVYEDIEAEFCASAMATFLRHQLLTAAPRSVAIANPALAPYGQAAEAVYRHLQIWDTAAPSRITGNSVAQVYQYVATGNAGLGFIARAQLTDPATGVAVDHWPVPVDWYPAIEQQAVQLGAAADNPAATAFMAFLRSPAARDIIGRHGYRLP